MATFSENQVRHLYVTNTLKASDVVSTDAAGSIAVKYDTGKTQLYFKYMGPGGQTRSDLIKTASIISAKVTDADSLKRALKKYKLELDPTVNSGAPVAGQDYVLRIAFRNYIGLSEEDQYFKYGVVHAITGMTAETFYQTLLSSLEKNFSREISKLLTFSLDGVKASVAMTTNAGITITAKQVGTAGNSLKFAVASVSAAAAAVTTTTVSGVTTISASLTAAAKTIGDLKALIASDATASALITISGTDATAVSAETTAVTLTGGTTTGIIFEEYPQIWKLGTFEQVPVNFTLQPTTIVASGDERIWGTITAQSATSYIKNGKNIADLEYFLMGERGDQYRYIGFPNIIKTTYLVDSDKAYNLIDITYFYEGTNESVQKAQKTITLAVPKVGDTNSVSNVLANSIVTAINTATGLSIATLDVSA